MDLRQTTKSAFLLKDYIDGCDNIILDDGQLALKVYFEDGSQKVFEDIQKVIDWVQVRKIRAPFET